MEDAQTRINNWNADYNEIGPHSLLENLTPSRFCSPTKQYPPKFS
ncbi:hypothetical protein GI582_11850 [Sulfitobacter sp. BDSS02]|nr:hypothetical protein [Sulfitobacter sp. BDSS02]MBR9848602.1 transposase [Paracoccaceae bacterium]